MNELEKDVLVYIGEDITSPDVFSDITPIRNSINDAIEEISMLTGSYKEVYHLPLFKDQAFYRLKFSKGFFGYITNAWLRDRKITLPQTDIIKLTAVDPYWLQTNGDPGEYLQVGYNIVGVTPAPSASTDVLELTCVMIPERYASDDDRIKLRESFKKATVHYAVSEYYASRGDAKEATAHFKRYVDVLPISYPEAAEKPYGVKSNESG